MASNDSCNSRNIAITIGSPSVVLAPRAWDMDGHWRVLCEFGKDSSGAVVISRLTVQPIAALPRGGITQAGVLRKVSIRAAQMDASLSAAPKPHPQTASTEKTRGRPKTLMPFYLRVRDRYFQLLAQGSNAPAKTLALEFTNPQTGKPYTRTAMRSVIRRCRKMGLLNRSVSPAAGSLGLSGHAPILAVAPVRPSRTERKKPHGKTTRTRGR